jgi:hypothetical protein
MKNNMEINKIQPTEKIVDKKRETELVIKEIHDTFYTE